jgi:DNA-directed RNA polymerase subunit F
MELKIIAKEPLSLPQVAKMVKGLGKKDERAEVQNKILDFAGAHLKMKEDEAEKLREELRALDIATLSAEHITQIIDILPQDLAELKSVFAGSKTNLSPEQFQRIAEICQKVKK